MRLVTSGLFGSEVAQRLLGSGALAVGDADARRETRIASVSVALNYVDNNFMAGQCSPGRRIGRG